MEFLLAQFRFLVSFIKHFFIGVKYVFFYVWYNMIDYYLNERQFKKRENPQGVTDEVNPVLLDSEKSVDEEKVEQHILSRAVF